MFKVIGAKLGGLIDVTMETTDLSFIKYAKLREKGLQNCFMLAVLELSRASDKAIIGIFPLDDNLCPLSTSICSGIGMDMRSAEQFRNIASNSDNEKGG